MSQTRVVMNPTGPKLVRFEKRESKQPIYTVGGGQCTTPVYREEPIIYLGDDGGGGFIGTPPEEFIVDEVDSLQHLLFPQCEPGLVTVTPIPGSGEAVAQVRKDADTERSGLMQKAKAEADRIVQSANEKLNIAQQVKDQAEQVRAAMDKKRHDYEEFVRKNL